MPERRMVKRRCLKWARVVTKYMQIQTRTAEGPVVRRVPAEWGMRCLKWGRVLAQPPKRSGTREPVEIEPPPYKGLDPGRKLPKTKLVYRGEPFEGVSCGRGGKLTSAKRRALPSSAFGLPGPRKYPMPDVSHARNAKARASMQYRRGALSPQQYKKIVRKANRIIAACGGGTRRPLKRGYPKKMVKRGMITRRCIRFGKNRLGRRTCRKYRNVRVR